jgi:hypothetical protein
MTSRKTYPEHFYCHEVRLRAVEHVLDSVDFKSAFQSALSYARCSPDTLYRWLHEFKNEGKLEPATANNPLVD